MPFNILSIPPFNKQVEKLASKYPSFKDDLKLLVKDLAVTPYQGAPIKSGCRKIRLAIQSKGYGKPGGARVIIHLCAKTPNTLYLLAVYDKSEAENRLDREIVKPIAWAKLDA